MQHLLIEGSGKSGVVILAHGSGIAMDHPFMQDLSSRLAAIDLKVVRFEFPYMAHRRATGKKKFPDKVEVLQESFLSVIAQVEKNVLEKSQPLYLAGKSLGGRIASLLCDASIAQKTFVFGYPFHPINNSQTLRIAHLQSNAKHVHIFQGERDKFGDRQQVSGYPLSDKIFVHWLCDGDHDLQPRKSSGVTQAQNLDKAIECIRCLI